MEYVWIVVERETNRLLHNAITSLKAAIGKDRVVRELQRFVSHNETIYEAEGRFIE